MTLESDIASQVNRDIIGEKINLHYQPMAKDGKVSASEALLRFSINEGIEQQDCVGSEDAQSKRPPKGGLLLCCGRFRRKCLPLHGRDPVNAGPPFF